MSLNRWIRAAIGVVVLLFAGLVYAWSVMSAPIAVEFPGWTKAQLSLTFTLVMTFFCIGMLICGFLANRITPRVNMFVSAVLFLAGFYMASHTQSLSMLYIGFGVLCGLGCGLTYNAVMSSIVKWFPDRPGLISGVLLMGFGGGSFLIGKLYQAWTPNEVGAWRTSFMILGVVTALVLVVCAFFIKPPASNEVVAQSASGKNRSAILAELTPLQTLRNSAFWMYYVWAIFLSAAGLALISQASGIIGEVSSTISASSAATIVGLISICNAGGRVLFGGMYDKYGRSISMQLVNILFIVTSVILLVSLQTRSIVVVVIGFVIGGLAYSGVTPTNSSFVRSYCGAINYPINFSLIATNLMFASFGSTVSGALCDRSGSYSSTFYLMIALAVAGILCSLGISIYDKKHFRTEKK